MSDIIKTLDGVDITNPLWEEAGRVHDWRNYINEDLRDLWITFNTEQRLAIAKNAYSIACQEEWD